MSGMETRRGGGVNKGKQPAGTEAGGSQPPGGQPTGGENNPSMTLEALAAQMAESEARAQERTASHPSTMLTPSATLLAKPAMCPQVE